MFGNLGEAHCIYQCGSESSEFAFGFLRIFPEQIAGDDQFKDCVTQKFQPFIMLDASTLVLIQVRAVRYCHAQQRGVSEGDADTLLKCFNGRFHVLSSNLSFLFT